MGVINAENTLKYKSSQQLFDRIKKRLSSFDSNGLIDDGDFHKHVKYILEQLGNAVYKECEAVLPVKDFKARLPNNFKFFHAAYRCSFKWSGQGVKSINEQKPWIYYMDTEVTQICPPNCKIECKPDFGKTKIVIRTFVNGEDSTGVSHSQSLLILSPNVRDLCTDDCPSITHRGHTHSNNGHNQREITIDNEVTHIRTRFNEDSIYIQYYGLPIDEFELPMIPDQENIEKAIEYYIYSQLFEEWYWNTTVPDIVRMLADARQQYDFHLGMARSWAKLPSFAKMVQAIRRQRGNRKFYYLQNDRTEA
jgi:hypothetical protein